MVGAALFVGGLLAAAALLSGRGEAVGARLLLMSRPARDDELRLLAPAVTILCRAGLGPPLVELRVREGEAAVVAAGMGRRTVVVSAGLLEAVVDGALPQAQAAAVIGHAAALTRGGWVRSDPVIKFWSLPWQLLRAVALAAARVGRRLPLTSLAWRGRVVVVVIATVQNVQEGQPWLALGIGAVGALSYAIPIWEGRWEQTMLNAGDAALADAGLAAPWAAFLRRCPPTPTLRTRLRGLEEATPAGRPVGLVVGR
ncbi:hypothetical protein V3N99_08120 [Dermatophilaceae bacterium Soc4.6]